MAYGIDFDGVYYTDHERVDIGMMDTYKASLDLADEKDFQITASDFAIPEDGWWYILGTEIGGIVDKYDSDSVDGTVKYTGRSFRGVLNSYVVDTNSATRILQGNITDIINALLAEHGLAMFAADAADIYEGLNTTVYACEITAGTSIYDAIIQAAATIDMSVVLEFNSDKIIHIIPILKQDYTDYLKYSGIDAAGFQIGHSHLMTNHLVITSVDDIGNFRQIHLFTNKDNEVQTYLKSSVPYEASDYILDKSSQVMTGIDEKSEWKECDDSPVEKYRQISAVPANWDRNYDDYYYKDVETDSDGTSQVSYKNYEGVESDSMTLTTSKPADWDTNYTNYYTSSYDQATGKVVYSAVSGTSEIDTSNVTQVPNCPKDWKTHYSEYYYQFNNGTSIEYRSYATASKDKYTKMKSEPSDWKTNFTSYYRKVYKKETEIKVKGKKKKVVEYIDTISHSGAYYKACTATDDSPKGKVPSFSKRPHYKRGSVDIIPEFDEDNTYLVRTKTTTPTWIANEYYSGKKEMKAPAFDSINSFEKTYDHYENMVKAGLDFFSGLKADSIRAVTIDDFNANIGDTVGGTDSITGLSVVAEVTNINITIEKGILTTDYEIGG